MSTMTAREALEKAALICEERADDDCAFAIRALAAQQPLEPEAGAECNVPEGYTYGECYGRPARAQSSDASVSETGAIGTAKAAAEKCATLCATKSAFFTAEAINLVGVGSLQESNFEEAKAIAAKECEESIRAFAASIHTPSPDGKDQRIERASFLGNPHLCTVRTEELDRLELELADAIELANRETLSAAYWKAKAEALPSASGVFTAYIADLDRRAAEQIEWEKHPKCEGSGIGAAMQAIVNDLRALDGGNHREGQ